MIVMENENQDVELNEFQKFFIKHNVNIRLGLFFAAILLFMLATIRNNTYENHRIYDVNIKGYLSNIKNRKLIEIKEPEPKKTHISMEVANEGYNLYAPIGGGYGYRYGPSIIINDDDSLDAFFSSPGNSNNEWDWITYRHSDDGHTWNNEKIVLSPTGNSMDHYSVCDPGVIFFNDYYYLAYTSTITCTNNGINNNIYVARSKNPDGPYEKWNGYDWGGKPEPIIYYDESNDFWGAGEMSFVIVDEKLYMYYTWDCEHGNFTKVATSDLSENWPNNIKYQGIIYENGSGQDSCDVVYLEDYKKFIAFSTVERFSDNSGIAIYESDDGIHFNLADIIRSNVYMFAHNMGITKRKNGHIKMSDNLHIAYAYSNSSDSKGRWATVYQPISLLVYQDNTVKSFDESGSPTYHHNCFTNKKDNYICGLGVSSRNIVVNLGDYTSITTYGYNQYRKPSIITKELSYDYDDEIIEMSDNRIIPKQIGETEVIVHYKDFYTTFNVTVKEEEKEDYKIKDNNPEIVKFEPKEELLIFHLEDDNYHSAQIRAYVEFDNGKWGEACNDYTCDHPKYPAMINAERYLMTFEVEDEKIAEVDEKGIVNPKRHGQTKVKVTLDDKCFYVNLIVEF